MYGMYRVGYVDTSRHITYGGHVPTPDSAHDITLSDYIATARQTAGMTQQEVSDAASVDRKTVSRIESGAYTGTPETIARIAAAIGLQPRDALAVAAGLPATPEQCGIPTGFAPVRDAYLRVPPDVRRDAARIAADLLAAYADLPPGKRGEYVQLAGLLIEWATARASVARYRGAAG